LVDNYMLPIKDVLKKHEFTEDQKRNLRLDIFLLAFGLSFALEKLLLGLDIVFSDWTWFGVYGFFSVTSIILFLHDFYHDIKEARRNQGDN